MPLSKLLRNGSAHLSGYEATLSDREIADVIHEMMIAFFQPSIVRDLTAESIRKRFAAPTRKARTGG